MISSISFVHSSINLAALIRCTESFHDGEDGHQTTLTPLSIFIPTTTITTILYGQILIQIPSPTNSSSQSSFDVESLNEQILTRTLIRQKQIEQQENQTVTKEDPSAPEQSPSTENLPATTTTTTTTPNNNNNNNEEEGDYFQCSLEPIYTSTEMPLSSPQQRPSTAQQTDKQYTKEIVDEFLLLKNQYEQSKEVQYELVVNYHQTMLKVITSLQQANQAHQEQIEQFQSEILNHIQDNETLRVCRENFLLSQFFFSL